MAEKPLPGVKGDAGGLSAANYTVKGLPIDRSCDVPVGLAKHVLSGIAGEKRFDRTMPIEQRRDRHGRLHK